MTRITRLFGLAMVLALLMALVSTATAAPPDPDEDWCKNHPDNPKCSTTTTTVTTTTVVPGSLGVGFSCADYAALNPGILDSVDVWNTTTSKTLEDLELTSSESVCIDVSNAEAGSFAVKVDSFDPGAKKNSTLYALIKDSHPGDHCGHAVDMPGAALNLNLLNLNPESDSDGTITGIPAATLNACGTGYSEADVECEDGVCEVVDPTTDQDGTPDPLALMLGITGKPGITANVTITYTADE